MFVPVSAQISIVKNDWTDLQERLRVYLFVLLNPTLSYLVYLGESRLSLISQANVAAFGVSRGSGAVWFGFDGLMVFDGWGGMMLVSALSIKQSGF